MKAFITGGNGFIGAHLISHLLHLGYDLVVVDQQANEKEQLNNVSFYNCDIRDQSLSEIFYKERPDIIFHLAAQSSVPVSMTDPYQDAKTNVLGTINLLDNAIRYDVSKIIFASSAAVYGIPEQLPIKEAHPIQPTSFYGLSKAIAENYIRMYGDNNLIDYAILRFANVYGPGQLMRPEAGLITKVLYSAFEEQPLSIYGDGTQTRDFIYVKDLVNACEKAIYSSGTFNISCNQEISINELIHHVENLMDITLPTTYTEQRTGDIQNSRLDNLHAKLKLLWQPSFSIKSGLKHTLSSLETTMFKGV